MNKWFFIIILTLLALSCRKDEAEIAFVMPFEFFINIDAGLDPFQSHHYLVQVPTNYTPLAHQAGVSDTTITDIRGAMGRLTSIFSSGNYNFLNEIEILVYDPNDPSFKIPVFYRTSIPDDVHDVLDVIPDLPDVKQILSKSVVVFDINLKRLNFAPVTTIESRVELEFHAHK